MGYAFVMGPCLGCGRIFAYNPLRVPSLHWPPGEGGTRRPVCQNCVERANPRRIANGLEPIVPLPDAYEACDEAELES